MLAVELPQAMPLSPDVSPAASSPVLLTVKVAAWAGPAMRTGQEHERAEPEPKGKGVKAGSARSRARARRLEEALRAPR